MSTSTTTPEVLAAQTTPVAANNTGGTGRKRKLDNNEQPQHQVNSHAAGSRLHGRCTKRPKTTSNRGTNATPPAPQKKRLITGPISLHSLASQHLEVDSSSEKPIENLLGAPTNATKDNLLASAAKHVQKCFNGPLMPKVTPWPIHCPEATQRFPVDIGCPFKWGAFPDLVAKDIRAYTGRAPWNPQPITFKQVAQQEQAQHGSTSEEGIRKRFKKVNLAIFEATGVYFVGSSLGLKDDHGIPNDTDMKKLLEGTRRAQNSQHATNVDVPESAPTISKNEELVVEGPMATLRLKSPAKTPLVTRYIPKATLEECNIVTIELFNYFSPAAFDLWYTAICFGLRRTLPERIYKICQSPEGYIHQDEGTISLTMPTLLEMYCLSQLASSTEVSDMILDKIFIALRQDHNTYNRFHEGKFWDPLHGDVLRFSDLQVADIEQLWNFTRTVDPIRGLFCDMMSHFPKGPMKHNVSSANSMRDVQHARDRYLAFSQYKYRNRIVESFMDKIDAINFCELYHNHDPDERCYRSMHESEVSKRYASDKIEFPNLVRLLEHGGVLFEIQDETDSARINLATLYSQHPSCDWTRVRALKTFIITPQNGPQIRDVRPDYFDIKEMDADRRFPSHPGYGDPDWIHPLTEGAESEYKKEVLTLKDMETPEGAQRLREDKETGNILFDIEDDEWIPPSNFLSHISRPTDLSHGEWQDYRRWEWKQRGNKVPFVTVRRFRPYEDGSLDWKKDIFQDKPRGD